MNDFKERLTTNIKGSATQFFIFFLRLVAGAILGLSVAIATQTSMNIGIYSFMFIVITLMMVVLHLTSNLRMLGSIIFLLVLVLIGVLLKLYILTAVQP
jgi:succinate-acetate transporter protein